MLGFARCELFRGKEPTSGLIGAGVKTDSCPEGRIPDGPTLLSQGISAPLGTCLCRSGAVIWVQRVRMEPQGSGDFSSPSTHTFQKELRGVADFGLEEPRPAAHLPGTWILGATPDRSRTSVVRSGSAAAIPRS